MTDETFHELIANDLPLATQEVLQYEEATSPFDSPTWSDALALISSVVRAWPSDGLNILDSELGNKPDIVRAVVRGWSRGELKPHEAGADLGETRQPRFGSHR